MSPREIEFLNARISKRAKDMLKEDAEKYSISMTECLERLIEGTLPTRLESTMKVIQTEILAEIESLRKEIKK